MPEAQFRDDRDPGTSEETEDEVLHLGDRGTVDPRSEDDGIRRDDEWLKHTVCWVDGENTRIDYRPVHMYTLTDEVSVIPPKPRVY